MKRIINQFIIIITILVSSLLIISCEKEIDLDLRSVTPRLVIEGVVVKDSLAKVKLTKTKDFNDDNTYPPVAGAEIMISDDAGNSDYLFLDDSGWYMAQTLKGEVGRTYSLNVVYDEKTYTSVSKMPPMVPIDSITMFKFPVIDYPLPRVHFRDPLGTVNDYYRVKIYINNKYMDRDNESIAADRTDGIEIVDLLFVDEKKLEDEEIKKGDKISVELQSIDKGAYNFFYRPGELNPTSNIVGGALGYFSAYSFDRKEIIANW